MIKETKDGFKFFIGSDGSEKLIIDSSILKESIEYILQNQIKSITINSYQGYELDNIDFLGKVSNVIEGLHLPETKFDNKIINSLHKLKYLGIADNGRDEIDLSNFFDLESLACDYSPRLIGLETCNKLQDLTLTNYKSSSNDLSNLTPLNNLKELNLFKTNISSLEGIENFKFLKKFEVYADSKLETIKSVNKIQTLEELVIEKCKNINDYESLIGLNNLRKLIISESGVIKSLVFLKTLKNLDFLSFWGTEILDGNLSFCSGIKYVGFDNKRKYSHKMEYFIK